MDGDQKFALCVIGAILLFNVITIIVVGVVEANKPHPKPAVTSQKE